MPGRMGKGLLYSNRTQLFQASLAEWPTGSGQYEAIDLGRIFTSQALPDCAVFAVHGQDRYSGTPRLSHNKMTRHDERFLFASAIVFPALMAASVGLNPIRPEVAATRISASARVATASSPCSPSIAPGKASCTACSISGVSAKHATREGLNSCTCCARTETLLRAANATI